MREKGGEIGRRVRRLTGSLGEEREGVGRRKVKRGEEEGGKGRGGGGEGGGGGRTT